MGQAQPPLPNQYDHVILQDRLGNSRPAGELFKGQAVVVLCLRRLGCILCRAEAKKLWQRKAAFDQVGVRLVCVVHQMPVPELEAFQPDYWGGDIYLDQNKEFFALVGGGQIRRQSAWCMLNPFSVVWKTAMEAKNSVDKFNFRGDGTIMGGIVVMRPVTHEVEYIFPENEFGTYPDIEEIIKAGAAATVKRSRRKT